jgi:hypothetical protein
VVARFRKTVQRLLLASVIACGILMVPAGASMAAGPDHPLPPAGYRPDLTPPSGALVKEEVVTLPAAQCAAMNSALEAKGQAAESNCRAIHGSYGFSHQQLPAGTVTRTSNALLNAGTAYASAAYFYWGWYDYECALYGCWYWKVTLEEDGVANGANVWQWHVWCTPQGVNTSCTWKGYSYNGGGAPTFAMQFGENSCSYVIVKGFYFCIGHGMRRWIDDWGNGAGFSYW